MTSRLKQQRHLHLALNPSPALLSLASILSSLASGVASVFDASGDALKTIADGLGAGGVVDGLADATASCAYKATGSLGDATYSVAELCLCEKECGASQEDSSTYCRSSGLHSALCAAFV